jgi:hypothetical protein
MNAIHVSANPSDHTVAAGVAPERTLLRPPHTHGQE